MQYSLPLLLKKSNSKFILDTIVSLVLLLFVILNSDGEVKYDQNGFINIDELNKVIGELKGIDLEDTTFSVESFNEYNSIISEKKDKNKD